MYNKRINVFTGHFGSGKTEVAVNFTLNLKKDNKDVVIVDMDIVNPFFRTADAKKQLEDCGIKTILPIYANTNVDVPALPGEINMVFEQKNYKAVLDVGGDDLGARALSRYREQITSDSYDVLFVINTFRPMTDTKEKIINMIMEIEYSCKMKITGLVNNSNLLDETEVCHILEGQKIIEEVSKQLDIPISFICANEDIVPELKMKTNSQILPLLKNIKLPWQ